MHNDLQDPDATAARRPVISVDGVHVALEGTPILHDISLDVARGRLVGLLGPNGSGKTTLLRAISGLLPTGGSINFDGRPIASWKPRSLARRLAFVRQSVSLSFDFSVEELVLLGRSPHKRWLADFSADDRTLMQQALEQVDLTGFEARSVLSLSGGELQRVFLAQALVQEADVLLLDEPTAHLDVHYQFEFIGLVRRLVSAGRTAVAVFHDLEMAGRFADELLVLHGGRLVAQGTPTEVLTRDLIAEVFRMDARIGADVEGAYHISYHHPITHRTEQPPNRLTAQPPNRPTD